MEIEQSDFNKWVDWCDIALVSAAGALSLKLQGKCLDEALRLEKAARVANHQIEILERGF